MGFRFGAYSDWVITVFSLAKEVVLEGGVGGGDGDGLFGAVDDGRQAVRHVRVGADFGWCHII